MIDFFESLEPSAVLVGYLQENDFTPGGVLIKGDSEYNLSEDAFDLLAFLKTPRSPAEICEQLNEAGTPLELFEQLVTTGSILLIQPAYTEGLALQAFRGIRVIPVGKKVFSINEDIVLVGRTEDDREPPVPISKLLSLALWGNDDGDLFARLRHAKSTFEIIVIERFMLFGLKNLLSRNFVYLKWAGQENKSDGDQLRHQQMSIFQEHFKKYIQ